MDQDETPTPPPGASGAVIKAAEALATYQPPLLGKTFAGLRNIVRSSYFCLAPGIPWDLRLEASDFKATFLIAAVFALLFCLGGTSVATMYAHRFAGSDPGVRYFVQDPWNIALYLFVCPLYVACASCIVRIAFGSMARIAALADELTPKESRGKHPARAAAYVFLCVAIAFVLTIKYTSDALAIPNIKTYWFAETSASGAKTLNVAGDYYLILNFSLLMVTMFGVTCYVGIGNEVTRWSGALSTLQEFDVQRSKELLRAFTLAFPFTKLLTAAYVLNILIWQRSPLGKTSFNMTIALIALYLIGGYLVILPFDYIDLKWRDWYVKRREILEHTRDGLEDELNLLNKNFAEGIVLQDEFLRRSQLIAKLKTTAQNELEELRRHKQTPGLSGKHRWVNHWFNALFSTSLVFSATNIPASIIRFVLGKG